MRIFVFVRRPAQRLGVERRRPIATAGEELVERDVVDLGEAAQARDRDRPLAAFVGAEDGGLELLFRRGLHRLE